MEVKKEVIRDLHTVTLTVNGRSHTVTVESRKHLAEVLREDLGFTGTKVGCEHGVCGACTVLMNGEPVRSCLIYAVQADGMAIETVESLNQPDGQLHPIQSSFIENFGFQCGFCTSGMQLVAKSLLARNLNPTDEEIRDAISANICRCTGYGDIIKSVQAAAGKLREGSGHGE